MAYRSGSTLETASCFLAGNIEAELIPTAFSSLLLSTFLLLLLFSCILLVLYFSIRLLVTGLRYSSHGLVLRLPPPARLPCAATRGVGGGWLIWYLSDSLGCGGG